MVATLKVLIEPSFVPEGNGGPLDSADDKMTDASKPDRYITSSVKMEVWRRDGGKCVECGSKEKLEYDHIIPVSKGGSSTARNVQLLCEKCNRRKSDNIQ